MPSPIAHSAAGYAIYRVWSWKRTDVRASSPKLRAGLLALVIGLSLLPDVDSILGLITGNFGRYHNNLTHSLFVGLVIAGIIGSIAAITRGYRFADGFLLTLVCYSLHVVMDFFTYGRGVMALWPFSAERFASPIPIFYGLHWSQGVVSARHLVTLATEMVFVFFVVLTPRAWASVAGDGNPFSREPSTTRQERT